MTNRVGLRVRITVLASLAVGAALTLGAVFLVNLLRSRLDDAASTAAELRARDIAALASAGALPNPLALPGEETAFVQVVDSQGHVVVSSENVEGEPAISALRPPGAASVAITSHVRPLDQSEDATMRIVALNASTGNGPVTVYAGESLERAEDTIGAITRVLFGGVPALVALVGCMTWWAVGRTLGPVHAISVAMGEITATDLHRRVPSPKRRDEIGQLADAVNDTLDRLDSSVEQQRRFVADASHELRGPLASLRADLEISVTHPGVTDWRSVARDTLSDVENLQHLTDDLLLLARLDAKQPTPGTRIDLAEVVREALTSIRRPDVVLTSSGLDAPALLTGDRDELHRMVRNLVHNAETHTVTRIDVSLERSVGSISLSIEDDGPGVPLADRARIFERFVRLDAARTRDVGGSGLGLAIAREVAERHHATLDVVDARRGNGSVFVVRFSTAPRRTS